MPNQPEDFISFLAMLRSGKDQIIIDTETTGLKKPAEIWQIAIVDISGNILLQSRIRPILCPERPSFNNPDMTANDLKYCPTWRDIRPIIEYMTKDRDIIAYNATFDRYMFHCSDESNGFDKFSWDTHARWWCAMKAFSEFYHVWDSYYENYKWHKLSFAHQISGYPLRIAHDACNDCIMTADICRYMIETCGGIELSDIPQHLWHDPIEC